MVNNTHVPDVRWRQLPEDIVCAILEHLPSHDKQRLRNINSFLLRCALHDKYGCVTILWGDVRIKTFELMRRVQDPFILPFVHTIKLVVSDTQNWCGTDWDFESLGYPRVYVPTGEEVEAELTKMLAAVCHIDTLILDWPSSRQLLPHVLPQVWPMLGAQLRSLKIQADITHLQDLILLGAFTINLQVLTLTIKLWDKETNGLGHLLSGLIPTLIRPSRSSLTKLELRLIPEFKYNGNNLHVRDFLEALSQMHFVTLHHLVVQLPFQGNSARSEEGSLLRFLSSNALCEISINYNPDPHKRYAGFPEARFFRLASTIPSFTVHLRHLSLHVPSIRDKSSEDDLLPSIFDMISTINSPLEDFLLSGRSLEVDEVSGVVNTLSRWAGSLRQLRLTISSLLPSTFDLLSRTLPSLYILDIEAGAISGDEVFTTISGNQKSMVISANEEPTVDAYTNHISLDKHLVKFTEDPLHAFAMQMHGRSYYAWRLRRLLVSLGQSSPRQKSRPLRGMRHDILYNAIPSLFEIVSVRF